MRTAHLFAGGGGGLLADAIIGHTPVLAIEINAFCCQLLEARAAEWFPGLRVHFGDVRWYDWDEWRGGVDLIAAGFPCQDISTAGKGAGLAGQKSGLFREVLRAIDDVRPGLIFLENSPAIRTRGRKTVIAELVARGYAWRDGTLAAADVGAGHERKRWWLLAANTDGHRQLEQERRQFRERGWLGDLAAQTADASCVNGRTNTASRYNCDRKNSGRKEADCWPADGAAQAADALQRRLQVAIQRGGLREAEAETIKATARHCGCYDWAPPDTGLLRVVDGLAHRVHRIAALGNGQVPLAAAAAYMMLAHGDSGA